VYYIAVVFIQTDKLSTEIDPVDPFSCPYAEKWDAETLEHFIDSHLWISGMTFVYSIIS